VRPAGVAAALVVAALAGCSDASTVEPAETSRVQLTVSAAASMQEALTACARDFAPARVRLQFAGSDELAAQIRQGVRPDVYAAANTALPEALAQEGLLERPAVFAGNELVLAVPAEDAAVEGLDDLGRSGVTLVIGSESVPVGAYTREVLGRLDVGERRAILANVRSSEPDVKGVVGKLVQGAADAGFVYRSDVEAGGGELEAIELDDELKPAVAYAAGVVKGTKEPATAQAFLDDLREGNCHDALLTAGFIEPPP
jgi:molybdate transport system substrate-binding protein